jgi:hypothetical protein
MKRIIPFLFFCMACCTLSAQECTELKNDPDLRQELEDLANTAASKLMDCCSSMGGRNSRTEIRWDKDESGVCQARISKLPNRIIIAMTAYWNGSLSGIQYWIQGRLIIDSDNKSCRGKRSAIAAGLAADAANPVFINSLT